MRRLAAGREDDTATAAAVAGALLGASDVGTSEGSGKPLSSGTGAAVWAGAAEVVRRGAGEAERVCRGVGELVGVVSLVGVGRGVAAAVAEGVADGPPRRVGRMVEGEGDGDAAATAGAAAAGAPGTASASSPEPSTAAASREPRTFTR